LATRAPSTTAAAAPGGPAIVEDAAMRRLYTLLERVAPGTISVLLLGETGVGKEVVAEALHRLSPRAARPFVRLNCAALSETLLESELFGHEKGAFTGASQTKPGLLETAGGGTVFLDEVGELPLTTQVKLLRVLETREVMRVGGLKAIPIDVRFVSATNRDLPREVAGGSFRQDLLFRLNGVTISIPPLRERVEEIEPLCRAFLESFSRQLARHPAPSLSSEAVAFLRSYAWPGNVRELRNVIERAILLCDGTTIELEHLPTERASATFRASVPSPLPPAAPVAPSEGSLREDIGSLEKRRILEALAACGGNQSEAARQLGISRRTLTTRLTEYGVPRPRKGR
jgi:DNA-binding NtrC family response regulator